MTKSFILPSATSIRHRIERALRIQINRGSIHGYRDCPDLARSGCRIAVVFDVGANVGQSADKFSDEFPDAHVHSFEPVSGTFRTLTQRLRRRNSVSCHRLALASSNGQATLYLTGGPDPNSVTNSLIRPQHSVGSEIVETCTIDSFVLKNGIPRIDLLKIDAEGADVNTSSKPSSTRPGERE